MPGSELRSDEKQPPPVAHWKGKKIFVDFDDTLMLTSRTGEPPHERSGSRGPLMLMPDGLLWEAVRINHAAIQILGALRKAGATAVITSAAKVAFLERAIAATGIADVIDGVFGAEDLRYELNGAVRVCPKNYEPVLEALEAQDPLAECVIVGDDPTGDVPIAPMGIVTVLTTIDFPFGQIAALLGHMLGRGEGSFAAGFDRMVREGERNHGSAELEDNHGWRFRGGREGRARLVYCDRTSVQDAASQFRVRRIGGGTYSMR